jgi:hypothetical protein
MRQIAAIARRLPRRRTAGRPPSDFIMILIVRAEPERERNRERAEAENLVGVSLFFLSLSFHITKSYLSGTANAQVFFYKNIRPAARSLLSESAVAASAKSAHQNEIICCSAAVFSLCSGAVSGSNRKGAHRAKKRSRVQINGRNGLK